MAPRVDKPELNARQLAELSALADGTLDPARRAHVQERIDASPELRECYERERAVVEMLHEARAVRAPDRLRERIAAQRPSTSVIARRRIGYGGALAGALAAVVLALVLVLPAGTPDAPSIGQAAALADRGPSAPAPGPDPHAPAALLNIRIENLPFPNWDMQFGWRAVGQRTDRINGRQAVTVYYEWHGERIAYTIVSAPALVSPATPVRNLRGTALHTLHIGGHLVVTWRRAGHTCVLSGSGVPADDLQTLAAWS